MVISIMVDYSPYFSMIHDMVCMLDVLESTVSVNMHTGNLRQLWKDTVSHTKMSKLVIYIQSGTAI